MLTQHIYSLPLRFALCFFLVFVTAGCTSTFSQPVGVEFRERSEVYAMNAEEAELILKESQKDIVYGDGLGKLIANIAAVIAFPPYGIIKLGEAGIVLAGYEVDLTVEDPNTSLGGLPRMYQEVVSVPGRIVAATQGEQYRSAPELQLALEQERLFRAWKNTEWYLRYSMF
jgi:hypothetical protein